MLRKSNPPEKSKEDLAKESIKSLRKDIVRNRAYVKVSWAQDKRKEWEIYIYWVGVDKKVKGRMNVKSVTVLHLTEEGYRKIEKSSINLRPRTGIVPTWSNNYGYLRCIDLIEVYREGDETISKTLIEGKDYKSRYCASCCLPIAARGLYVKLPESMCT